MTNLWIWPVLWAPNVCLPLPVGHLSLLVYINASNSPCQKISSWTSPLTSSATNHSSPVFSILRSGATICPFPMAQTLITLLSPTSNPKATVLAVSKIHPETGHVSSLLLLPLNPTPHHSEHQHRAAASSPISLLLLLPHYNLFFKAQVEESFTNK